MHILMPTLYPLHPHPFVFRILFLFDFIQIHFLSSTNFRLVHVFTLSHFPFCAKSDKGLDATASFNFFDSPNVFTFLYIFQARISLFLSLTAHNSRLIYIE